MTINLGLPQNWLTTLGGLMAGVPAVVLNSGMVLSTNWQHAIGLIGGLGVMIGLTAAKQYNVHSTATQVQTSTVEAAVADAKKP